MPVGFPNGHYANPSLYLEGATIKNDHHKPTDKEMRLSLSVWSAEDMPLPQSSLIAGNLPIGKFGPRIGSDSARYRNPSCEAIEYRPAQVGLPSPTRQKKFWEFRVIQRAGICAVVDELH
jgi:hypothetical protein